MKKVLAVIGDPIMQSKSPLMHQAAFSELELDAVYVPFHVRAEHLQQAVEGIRALGIYGINVTIPHKVEVMKYLDDIDPLARQIGAVNTIVNRDGKLIGYNTDGIGYVRSLKEEAHFDPKGKRIVVVGAGGACRAVAFALAQAGASQLIILNRTQQTAEQLASHLVEHTGIQSFVAVDVAAQQLAIEQADLIINTTSIGMFPNREATPFNTNWIQSHQVVSDLIYNPLRTKMLDDAYEKGATALGGLGMFVYQGAYGFEYWTGMQAPIEVMRTAVLQSLGYE